MSMRRSIDRIRTTHTGSLPRPPDMLEMLHQLAAGHSIDLAAYESALTRHVTDIVKRQVEADRYRLRRRIQQAELSN
jgi:5-methyltetrahydropteroyltriglutamate--homocysteine methyltransferase